MKTQIHQFVLCVLVLLAMACGKIAHNTGGEINFDPPTDGGTSGMDPSSDDGCRNDLDCRFGRVCVNKECHDPSVPSVTGGAGNVGGAQSIAGSTSTGGTTPIEAGAPSTAGAGGEGDAFNPFVCPRSVSIDECGENGWVICDQQPLVDVPRSSILKGSDPALYWYANDGKRYVFPNEKTFRSWFPAESDCPMIYQISDGELATTYIGGNMHIRPGSYILKHPADPKSYAVTCGGVLRWLESESVAANIYGNNWWTYILDVPDAFIVNYSVGQSVHAKGDYDPYAALDSAPTPEADVVCSNNP